MGANIKVQANSAIIQGPTKLHAARVQALIYVQVRH